MKIDSRLRHVLGWWRGPALDATDWSSIVFHGIEGVAPLPQYPDIGNQTTTVVPSSHGSNKPIRGSK